MRRVAVVLLGLGAVVSAASRAPVTMAQAPPAYLVMLAAGIEQEPASGGSPGRVIFQIILAGRPPCGAGQAGPVYTFLLDRDRSRATGTVLHAVPSLGVDVVLDIRCDPGTGRFVSDLDPVTLRDALEPSGAVVLELVTPARPFARADVRWLAIARQDRRFTRLPEQDVAVWQSADLWMN